MKKILLSSYVILLIMLISCGNPSKKTEEKQTANEEISVKIPVFNADSAYNFVQQQVDFGPRVCNTPAHEKAGDFLEQKLRQYTSEVFIQKGILNAWDGTPLKFRNFIASFNPDESSRILLVAHWDSRPYADHDPDPANRKKPVDGANDGASGVGVLLEVARQLQIESPQIGVDILLVDAEDYGPPQDKAMEAPEGEWWGLGSQYWAKNPHKQGYKARYGILLDMVGATGATFLTENISMTYAGDIVRKVWSVASRAGYGTYFIFEEGIPVNDDHLYINQFINIPTIDIIHIDQSTESGFFRHWHTTTDNMAAIDRSTLKAVGQTLLTVIYTEQ